MSLPTSESNYILYTFEQTNCRLQRYPPPLLCFFSTFWPDNSYLTPDVEDELVASIYLLEGQRDFMFLCLVPRIKYTQQRKKLSMLEFEIKQFKYNIYQIESHSRLCGLNIL